MAAGKTETANPITKSTQFFREAWDELKKVHAPSPEETLRATGAVLLMVFVFAVFLGVTDWLVGFAMQTLLYRPPA